MFRSKSWSLFHQHRDNNKRRRNERRRSSIAISFVWLLLSIAVVSPLRASAEINEPQKVETYQAANFQINYRDADSQGTCNTDDGALQPWPADAQAAMNHVVDILDDLINSTVPIVIDACYQATDMQDENGDPVPDLETLASAGPNAFLTQDDVAALPVANRDYAIALANAISGVDQNGAEVEITMSANSRYTWDFCTVGCTVDTERNDFVSTIIHEVLHGLGFFTSFDPVVDDNNTPTGEGMYSDPPAIMDDYVVRLADNTKLIDLENNSATLWNAMQQGSGTVGFNGPNTLAINGSPPFIYTPTQYEQGSSMSHWDDDAASSLGRMMNAATDAGPSSRVVDAITLMALKDIGWSVNEASDHGDVALNSYGDAYHINAASFVNHIKLGATFSSENGATVNDASDDGVTHPGNWAVGASGGSLSINVTSTEPSARGCLSGWIDWNRDNDFGDASEQIVAMQPMTVQNQNFTFDIPNSVGTDPVSTIYNGRIRLIPDWDADGACDDQVAISPALGLFGGEVEDYNWLLTGGTVVIPPTTNNQDLYLPVVVQ